MLRSICSIYSDLSEQAGQMKAVPFGDCFFGETAQCRYKVDDILVKNTVDNKP